MSQCQPTSYLEIGSFEGFSLCRVLQWALRHRHQHGHQPLQRLICIDTWSGGEEHEQIDFRSIERRFDANATALLEQFPDHARPRVNKLKTTSQEGLRQMLNLPQQPLDLIYVDGSHHAADVLQDIVMGWQLLAINGTMVLDDYLWREPHGRGAIHEPKLAIDAFTSIYGERLAIIGDVPLRQLAFKRLR
jgi:hypothetical protein